MPVLCCWLFTKKSNTLQFYLFYLLFLEDYKLGWAWGMAILAAILELVGMITAAMSQKSD